MFKLLKPGAYAEMDEPDRCYRGDGEIVGNAWSWKRRFDDTRTRMGYDVAVGAHLAFCLRDAGFVDVHTYVYRVPFGT